MSISKAREFSRTCSNLSVTCEFGVCLRRLSADLRFGLFNFFFFLSLFVYCVHLAIISSHSFLWVFLFSSPTFLLSACVMIQDYTILYHIPNSMWNTLSISALSDTLFPSLPFHFAHADTICRHSLIYQMLVGTCSWFNGEPSLPSFASKCFVLRFAAFVCLMIFSRWADTNALLPIPKSPGVQCGGGWGCLLKCIEYLTSRYFVLLILFLPLSDLN
jgi:hypothetical protein